MAQAFLPHLNSGWHVDQAILSEQDRLVVIRFGVDDSTAAMLMDELLFGIADVVRNFAVFYVCDVREVPDYNDFYELEGPMTLMFFFRNKHMMCDFGTGDNNKLTHLVTDAQEMIDILECIFRGARKGRGLVTSPYDYSRA